MADSFFTGTDAELYTGSNAFATKITATPVAYGLTAPQATAYQAVNDIYAAAYEVAIDPNTRTQGTVTAKNGAKSVLKGAASDLAKIIDGTPTVTDQQKIDLGLNVRATPTPSPVPSEPPVLEIKSRMGSTVTIRLHDGSGTRRAKPDGVQGASVFSFVGATPPADVTAWVFQGNTTRKSVDVSFPSSVTPGSTVWLCAFWYNTKGQSGPGCAPVSAIIAGGAMKQAA